MSDLSTEYQVTENHSTPTPERSTSPNDRGRQNSDHWSQRIRDPLGRALKRLSERQNVLEVKNAPTSDLQQPAAPVTVPKIEREEEDSRSAILSLPSATTAKCDVDQQRLADRRRFPRRQSECAVALVQREKVQDLTPRETDWMLRSSRQVGRLLDLSQTGVCLMLEQEIAVGSEVLLRISNHQLDRHVDSSAMVIHCYPADEGRFSIHCQVLYDFTLDQLQDLGQPLIPAHVLA